MLLDDRTIRSLKPGAKRRDLWDEAVPGLVLRMTPSGAMSWAVWYRAQGIARRVTLGAYDPDGVRGAGLTLKRARDAAQDILAKVRLGADPQAQKVKAKAEARQAQQRRVIDATRTVEALTRRALEALPLRATTAREWGRLAKAEIIPALGARLAGDVTRGEIREWAAKIAKRSAYSGNRAFETLRRVYSWAVEEELLTGTPFVGLKKPGQEVASERVLSDAELAAVLLGLEDISERDYADAVLLLALTGARRAMAVGMRRAELLDLDGTEPRWVIPGGFAGRSKSGRPHVVPLSPEALAVVRRRLADVDGELLFPVTRARRAGDEKTRSETLTWSSRFVADLRTRVQAHCDEPMARWRVHDLRSAIATHLRERFRVSSDVVSLLLGHTPQGPRVTRVYLRAELLPERRAALVAWGAWLTQLREQRRAEESARAAGETPKKRGAKVLPHARRA